MKTALDRIIDYKAQEVDDRKSRTSLSQLTSLASEASAPRGFRASLDHVVASGQNALICELKRKSPSAGLIRAKAEPHVIARSYEEGGAACISVLTDGPSFGGSIGDLEEVRRVISLPVLRKDFMIDPWQIYESRAHGADAVLLIMSVLEDTLAKELLQLSTELGMDTLVEVHDEQELKRATQLGANLIGVNNRNLKTMSTDLAVSEQLSSRIGNPHSLVSESGVKSLDDISRLRRFGFERFLIGESLMKETSPETAVSNLVTAR